MNTCFFWGASELSELVECLLFLDLCSDKMVFSWKLVTLNFCFCVCHKSEQFNTILPSLTLKQTLTPNSMP